ncbi:MAG: VIT1/CCC1 transporter family protein [Chitinophagaceae bacterium]|nr:VIT1/CCC1 transporter family protein [Chitinophagaceae bacterium]
MLDTHLHHHEEHLQSSDLLKDIVIGMSDGLTVPFALAAGISGAVHGNVSLVWIAGVAEIAAGSIAMGLGGYLAGKTEQDHYNSELKNEYWETKHKREVEINEVKKVFIDWGLSEATAMEATGEIIKDDKRWVDFMMKHELGLEEPDPKRARKSAFNIGMSYIVGGMIPLTPYFFVGTAFEGLKISAVITLICLFVFGFFKSKLTGVNPIIGGLKVVMIGAAAASAAFGIAKLIAGGR